MASIKTTKAPGLNIFRRVGYTIPSGRSNFEVRKIDRRGLPNRINVLTPEHNHVFRYDVFLGLVNNLEYGTFHNGEIDSWERDDVATQAIRERLVASAPRIILPPGQTQLLQRDTTLTDKLDYFPIKDIEELDDVSKKDFLVSNGAAMAYLKMIGRPVNLREFQEMVTYGNVDFFGPMIKHRAAKIGTCLDKHAIRVYTLKDLEKLAKKKRLRRNLKRKKKV